jgi:signal recognition particle subunit SRP54
MFETLSERLQAVFDKLNKRGYLNEQDVDTALREVRQALLEADVNFKIVKDFLVRVRERAIGAEVHKSLTPGQAVVKIVHEELLKTLGEGGRLDLGGPAPRIVMLVGLQGAGKTTMAAKLGLFLRKKGQKPLLVAADVYRPAAITQLELLGKQLSLPVHSEGDKVRPLDICLHALDTATRTARDVVIIDTAGRLQIDDRMMGEIEEIKQKLKPREVLLVADAMTGQEAVRIADAFNKRVSITGLILTKVDGDARGGAAISMRETTGVPIKFLGQGEKPDALEEFHPDRLASRILGMGDVLTLIEKVTNASDIDEAAMEKSAKRMMEGKFDLEDFLGQIKQIKKLGPLHDLLKMIPGFDKVGKDLSPEYTENQMKRIEAIISSMTTKERRNPELLDGSRRRRIARGSGTTVEQINDLMKQFKESQKMMRQIQNNPRMRAMSGLMRK